MKASMQSRCSAVRSSGILSVRHCTWSYMPFEDAPASPAMCNAYKVELWRPANKFGIGSSCSQVTVGDKTWSDSSAICSGDVTHWFSHTKEAIGFELVRLAGVIANMHHSFSVAVTQQHYYGFLHGCYPIYLVSDRFIRLDLLG